MYKVLYGLQGFPPQDEKKLILFTNKRAAKIFRDKFNKTEYPLDIIEYSIDVWGDISEKDGAFRVSIDKATNELSCCKWPHVCNFVNRDFQEGDFWENVYYLMEESESSAKEVALSRFKKTDDREYDRLDMSELPCLVLSFMGPRKVNNIRQWQHLYHQTSGHACNQFHVFGTILHPNGILLRKMIEISSRWFNSQAGMLSTSIDDVLEYRNMLLDLDLDCTTSYIDFSEGVYPIDVTPKLFELIEDDITIELDNLFEPEENVLAFTSWKCHIFGTNSD